MKRIILTMTILAGFFACKKQTVDKYTQCTTQIEKFNADSDYHFFLLQIF